jgi:lysophospholipase L1-like esterase
MLLHNVSYTNVTRSIETILVFGLLLLVPVSVQGQSAEAIVDRPYWQHRVDLFQRLPNPEGEIVFLGDSITDGSEWAELVGLPQVTNRGISGDTAWGVMARTEEVTEGDPAKIFLLIGTNDLSHGEAVADVNAKIAEVLETIGRQAPDARVYLQSVLPVYGEDSERSNKRIRALNAQLVEQDTLRHVTYVDIATPMQTNEGTLRKDLSTDGLHLNGKGYYLWYSVIRKYLEE